MFNIKHLNKPHRLSVLSTVIFYRCFFSGHGTFYGNDDIVASVAGAVRQVNKLITVQPFKSR